MELEKDGGGWANTVSRPSRFLLLTPLHSIVHGVEVSIVQLKLTL